ncbi:hypothetical protein QUF70_05165 [Desulfobacterales bacterium HSG17]|nr:hypothetical protein [Desulfobacterales bacterium HSG17]
MDRKISDFRRTVLTYFILIAAAAMGFCSYFLYEATMYQVKIQNHIIVAIIVFLACISVILIVFMRNIIIPIEKISRAWGVAANELSHGHLDVTLPVLPGDDVKKIGESLNDFTVNVQEVLLHIQTHSNFIIETIEQIKQKLLEQNEAAITPEIERDYILIRQHIHDIQEMIQAFDYYDICLENGKVMAEKEKHS